MRRLPVAAVSLIVMVSALFVGFVSGDAQDAATPPGASRTATVIATVAQPDTGFDLWLMRFELAPGDSTGAIDNDQTRVVEVVRGEIRFRLDRGDAWVFRGRDASKATQIAAGGNEWTTLRAGDRLSLSPDTSYAYENGSRGAAEVSISALVPSGSEPGGSATTAGAAPAPTPNAGVPMASPAALLGCRSGCSHP